ncbi:hypothetical protein ISCGN_025700 [Ixodes scapularis]
MGRRHPQSIRRPHFTAGFVDLMYPFQVPRSNVGSRHFSGTKHVNGWESLPNADAALVFDTSWAKFTPNADLALVCLLRAQNTCPSSGQLG